MSDPRAACLSTTHHQRPRSAAPARHHEGLGAHGDGTAVVLIVFTALMAFTTT
jgi:hypothetical protein